MIFTSRKLCRIFLLANIFCLASCVKKDETNAETTAAFSEGLSADGSEQTPANNINENPFKPLPETMKPRPPSLGKILREECGLENPDNRQDIILDQQMFNPYTRELISGLLDVYIDINTTITMLNTQEKSDFTINLDIQEVRSIYQGVEEVNAPSVVDQATSESLLFMGTTTSYDADELSPIPEKWSDIVCTVAFAGRVVTTIGGYETEMRFNPPLPTGVSPTPIAERFVQELGDNRYFDNIEVEILSTNNPRLKVGEKIKGSVFMERLPTSRTVPGRELKGDVAYRITNNFRDRQTTSDLGLLLWFEVYVDHETKQYSNFASDLGTDLQYLYPLVQNENTTAPSEE
ncbi:MAG: hypothetical protein ACOH5I_08330 [Oligoflexus sp.]